MNNLEEIEIIERKFIFYLFIILIIGFFIIKNKEEIFTYQGKIQYERYFINDSERCSIKIQNTQIERVPVEQCLFINKDKEYIVKTNGFKLIEIQEKN